MKQWKCTVCGYIHEGPEPPDKCPVCGAGKDKFEEVVEEKAQEEATGLYGLATGLMVKHKAHPIAVHLPNGLLPVTVLFLVMSFVFDAAGFDTAAFYNLVVVALAMPGVLISGYVDWQAKYDGAVTDVFKRKIAMGVIVTALSWALVLWRLLDADVAAAGETSRYIFLVVHLAVLGAAGYAGDLGGKLVFND